MVAWTMRFPRVLCRCSNSPESIGSICDRFEMSGVHAGAITAKMVDSQMPRNGTIG